MILNEATAQEVNKILTDFIIEDNHVVGIVNYGIKILLLLFGITLVLSIIGCIIVCMYNRNEEADTKMLYCGVTVGIIAVTMLIIYMLVMLCGARVEQDICAKYDKIYQESVEILSSSTEKNVLEHIYENNNCDTNNTIDENENENSKNYTCIILNENNEIKSIKLPYNKVTLIKDETSYIEVVYEEVKYLNGDVEQVIKSANIYVTEDMLDSMLK